jgi:hypothetical protein
VAQVQETTIHGLLLQVLTRYQLRLLVAVAAVFTTGLFVAVQVAALHGLTVYQYRPEQATVLKQATVAAGTEAKAVALALVV